MILWSHDEEWKRMKEHITGLSTLLTELCIAMALVVRTLLRDVTQGGVAKCRETERQPGAECCLVGP